MTKNRLILLVISGAVIAMVSMGMRNSFGLFADPVTGATGWGRDVFGLAVALQNLFWGLGQPVAGALSDRFGAWRILFAGGFCYALGIALIPLAGAPLILHLTAGLLVGLGTAFSSFAIIMSVYNRVLPPERRAMSFGWATAAASFGQFVFARVAYELLVEFEWMAAFYFLGAITLLICVMAPALHHPEQGISVQKPVGAVELRRAIGGAFGHTSFNLLFWGFFVCGFHVAFITVHLPPYLGDLGMDVGIAAWAIGMIGLFNIVCSLGSGYLCGHMQRRTLLSWIYGLRAIVITLFLVIPPSEVTVLLFTAVMGLLWLSTVPATAGLVEVMFGTRTFATLFGLVFLGHQIGAFAGSWLGGILREWTGSYDAVWWLAVRSACWAVIHIPIKERAVFAPAY